MDQDLGELGKIELFNVQQADTENTAINKVGHLSTSCPVPTLNGNGVDGPAFASLGESTISSSLEMQSPPVSDVNTMSPHTLDDINFDLNLSNLRQKWSSNININPLQYPQAHHWDGSYYVQSSAQGMPASNYHPTYESVNIPFPVTAQLQVSNNYWNTLATVAIQPPMTINASSTNRDATEYGNATAIPFTLAP